MKTVKHCAQLVSNNSVSSVQNVLKGCPKCTQWLSSAG